MSPDGLLPTGSMKPVRYFHGVPETLPRKPGQVPGCVSALAVKGIFVESFLHATQVCKYWSVNGEAVLPAEVTSVQQAAEGATIQ